MACFITGITPTSDIGKLEEMLGGLGDVDRTKLTIITPAKESEAHESSFLNFIHPAEGGAVDAGGHGGVAGGRTQIMTGFGGTGVPGIASGPSGGAFIGAPQVIRQLGTLPIPGDEVGNYNDALRDGRSVVAYECSDADHRADLEAAFRQAGVRHVKTFVG